MNMQTPSVMRDLVEKIHSLPTERITEVEDFVDFLKERSRSKRSPRREPLDFPVISVGRWPENFSLRREDMYGDDGR
ncbi:MAG: Protein of unknown function (DUF2281) [Candidatus Kentron sp. G]|nr:MAG: Protein of unknown function (DUF2281) [Candidatus Kentron sp. G]VFM95991.1 MAG: Protein of unknown function (DUF2281) [Candidatus Kentron sp. G]VFM97826.1 MAG: Protein of unknown function (DUF2281) [Candidatus Kentron sp. G]